MDGVELCGHEMVSVHKWSSDLLGRQILFNCMKVDLLLTQGLLLGGSYSKKRVSKQASGN